MTIVVGKLKGQESMGMNSVSTVAQTSSHAVKGNGIKFKISKKYDCGEEMDKTTYKPLPESVVVRVSPIHGYGLFAIDNIPQGTDLGVSHIFAVGFKNNYVRTPLGGFINHSDTPNCYKVQSHEESVLTYYNLHTTKDVEKGEELTVTYTLYDIAPN